jgi:hypothetical protein
MIVEEIGIDDEADTKGEEPNDEEDNVHGDMVCSVAAASSRRCGMR